ncbi:hypothetical protein OVA11_06115 [Caulobacter sp. SL161]|uniref:hypothetical protein n=1 Tax=Caulobacter sp. SL161 TaxID=2995156 RepID=UPI0022731BA9|nr:hypothetical protein [Caulobacter sp. SL161]MCY1646664.1 hypothetical protein [Caulobacter sp. SL161]
MSDALTQLEADVSLIPAAIQARTLGSILGRVSEKTQDANRQAQRCVALVEMANSLDGLSTATVERAVSHAIKQTLEVGEMLANAQGADDLEAIYEDYGEIIVALRDLDQQVRFVWSLKAKSDYASLIPVGHLLMRIAGAEALGRKLVDIGTKAEALAARAQPAETLAPEITSLKADRQQALADMAKFTESPEVDGFLDAVTKGAATLETVTPKVTAWLKAHDALGAFKVTG